MNRFRNILAVYNGCFGSETVLEQAVSLARNNGARLTLVNTQEGFHSADAYREARKRLSRIEPWVIREGVRDVATTVLIGSPHLEIIRQVMHHEHDLVMLCPGSSRRLTDVIFGDLARRLMRQCPCPVWILKPKRATSCTRVLAAVGARTNDGGDQAVNTKILELALSLARSQDAKFHILRAWRPEGNDAEMLTNEISDKTREGILQRNEARHRGDINAILARYPVVDLDHEVHLPYGQPIQNILALTERLNPDVLVMGTANRVGVQRVLMGNSAESVFGTIRCGLLIVKPDSPLPQVPLPLVGRAGGVATPVASRH